MKTKHFPILFLSLVCIIVGVGISSSIERKQTTPIKIMTSIFPLKEFAHAVVGEWGDVELLLPPGAEIHAWRPKPSDLVKLSSAEVFVYIGAELEPWADDILRSVKNPNLRVIEASRGLSLIGHEEEGEEHDYDYPDEHKHNIRDPHIWLDFIYDKKIIDRIVGVLSEVDPVRHPVFRKNADIYKRKLDALDEMYRKGLAQCDQKTIVLGGHAAFGYLARRYNFSQISLYGLSPDSRPTPRQLIDVVDFIKERGIGTIFFEIEVSSELAQVIAKETGAETRVLNPGASLPKKQDLSRLTFLRIMEKNLESLKNGLRCR
ncbi:MAG: zinc ABC transporter substrate-binding protein [Candidatus Aminicenantes bacterium]|nr:MAG: zinc ABC transporter substrate-binding protein [Candidatus Aminicenantes bacterium]